MGVLENLKTRISEGSRGGEEAGERLGMAANFARKFVT